MSADRHSIAETAPVLTDADEIARREAENGIRQFDLALEIIRTHVKDAERPFRLRSSTILRLHKAALDGLHPLAGTWRNTPVKIGGSGHQPPDEAFVSEEVELLCEYVNEHWTEKNAVHLCAYVLWKLNWIHPFSDGNGRTARAVAYIVLSAKLDSLLPGAPTIPEQIAGDKTPYYKALEAADLALNAGNNDVSELEKMLEAMLAKQLLNAAKEASGEAKHSEASKTFH
ncbi:MAG: Fic family protein [Pseudolabrys sp.]